MKIVVVNEKNSDNIGDRAISDAMNAAIASLGHETVAYDFSMRKERDCLVKNPSTLNKKTSEVGSLQVIKSKIRPFLPAQLWGALKFCLRFMQAFKKIDSSIDLVLIGGGQLILSNKSFPFSMLAWAVACKLRNVKVCLLSVGVGAEFSKFNALIYRVCLSIADRVYVRDYQSLKTLAQELNYSEVMFAPDCVYSTSVNDFSIQEIGKKNSVVIAPIEYGVHLRYYKELGEEKKSIEEYTLYWVEIIKSYSQEFDDVIITATTNLDFIFAHELYKILKMDNKSSKIVKCASWMEYMSLVQSSDLVVSARMHALILAQVCGVKVEAVVASKKIQCFKESLNYQDIGKLKIQFYEALSECIT